MRYSSRKRKFMVRFEILEIGDVVVKVQEDMKMLSYDIYSLPALYISRLSIFDLLFSGACFRLFNEVTTHIQLALEYSSETIEFLTWSCLRDGWNTPEVNFFIYNLVVECFHNITPTRDVGIHGQLAQWQGA